MQALNLRISSQVLALSLSVFHIEMYSVILCRHQRWLVIIVLTQDILLSLLIWHVLLTRSYFYSLKDDNKCYLCPPMPTCWDFLTGVTLQSAVYGCPFTWSASEDKFILTLRLASSLRSKAHCCLHCSHVCGSPHFFSELAHRWHLLPIKAAIMLQYSHAVG